MNKIMRTGLTGAAFLLLAGCASEKDVEPNLRDVLRTEINQALKTYEEPQEEIKPEFSSELAEKQFTELPFVSAQKRLTGFTCQYEGVGRNFSLEVTKPLNLKFLKQTPDSLTGLFLEKDLLRNQDGAKIEDAAVYNQMHLLYSILLDYPRIAKTVSISLQPLCRKGSNETCDVPLEVRLGKINCHRYIIDLKDNCVPYKRLYLFTETGTGKPVRFDLLKNDGTFTTALFPAVRTFYVYWNWKAEQEANRMVLFEFARTAASKKTKNDRGEQIETFSIIPLKGAASCKEVQLEYNAYTGEIVRVSVPGTEGGKWTVLDSADLLPVHVPGTIANLDKQPMRLVLNGEDRKFDLTVTPTAPPDADQVIGHDAKNEKKNAGKNEKKNEKKNAGKNEKKNAGKNEKKEKADDGKEEDDEEEE